MDSLHLTDIWIPAGLILGFQVTLFAWRLQEEARVGTKGSVPWLTPADYLNLLGMLVFVLGVYLLPLTGLLNAGQAAVFCGLGVLMFVGHIFAIAGHYQLFNRSRTRTFAWFPVQERIAISITVALVIVYLCLSAPKVFHSS